MEKKTFLVPDIGCDGCVRTVENEVGEVAGVQSVKADLSSKQVTVAWDAPANWEAIRAKLVEIEYPPADA